MKAIIFAIAALVVSFNAQASTNQGCLVGAKIVKIEKLPTLNGVNTRNDVGDTYNRVLTLEVLMTMTLSNVQFGCDSFKGTTKQVVIPAGDTRFYREGGSTVLEYRYSDGLTPNGIAAIESWTNRDATSQLPVVEKPKEDSAPAGR